MNNALIRILAVLAVAGAFMIGAAYAAPAPPGVNSNANLKLAGSMAQVNCETSLTAGYITDIVAIDSNLSNLNTYKSALTADTAQLEVYFNAGNVTEFRYYLSGTYHPELVAAKTNITTSLKGVHLNASQKATLSSDYNGLRTTFISCDFGALKLTAADNLALWQISVSNYNKKIAWLHAHGINNTANLTTLLNNANVTVINPFNVSISSATNLTQIKKALGEYCLFNGCINGLNYHLAAHFTLNKIGLVLTRLESVSTRSLNQTLVNQINLNLTTASGELNNVVGISAYNQTTNAIVWGNLDNANAALTLLLKESRLGTTTSTTPSTTTVTATTVSSTTTVQS